MLSSVIIASFKLEGKCLDLKPSFKANFFVISILAKERLNFLASYLSPRLIFLKYSASTKACLNSFVGIQRISSMFSGGFCFNILYFRIVLEVFVSNSNSGI